MSSTNETIRRMNMIALDTATSSMTAALAADGKLLAEHNSRAERNHSMYLVPALQQLLQSQGMRPRELQAVAVGAGPGSYTGVRIGISVAKTMAWALHIPLFTVSSLAAMALGGLERVSGSDEAEPESADRESIWIVPLMDARRGNVFTGLYTLLDGNPAGEDLRGEALGRASHGPEGLEAVRLGGISGFASHERWACLVQDGIRPMDQWVRQLRERLSALSPVERPARIAFVGEAEPFANAAETLAGTWPGRVTIQNHEIRGADVARLAYARWHSGERTDAHLAVPNYTQPPEAEVKLLAKKSREGG